MPTQEDLLAIESLRGLAASIRGVGQTQLQTGKEVVNVQLGQQQRELERGQRLEDLASQRQFTTGERIAGQEFREGESILEREAALDRIKAKTPDTEVKIIIKKQSDQFANDLRTSGSATEGPGGTIVGSSKVEGHAKLLLGQINVRVGETDKEFDAGREAYNGNIEASLKRARDEKGVKGPGQIELFETMKILPGESRSQWIARQGVLRREIIEREIEKEVKRRLGPAAARRPGAPPLPLRGAVMKRKIEENQIREEVQEKFDTFVASSPLVR